MEFMGVDIVSGGYYYVDTRCGAKSIFVHFGEYSEVTHYSYRIHLVDYHGIQSYKLARNATICSNSAITKIRPCNENERAMLDWYIRNSLSE